MTTAEAIAQAVAGMRSYIDRSILRIFGWTLISKVGALGQDGVGMSDEEPNGQRLAQRLEPFGFRGVPIIKKTRAFWIRIGMSNVAIIGILPTSAFGPIDLGEGESAQYGAKPGTYIKVDKDGNVQVPLESGAEIDLGATSLLSSDGVVTGRGVDPFTGLTYELLGNVSSRVKAKK